MNDHSLYKLPQLYAMHQAFDIVWHSWLSVRAASMRQEITSLFLSTIRDPRKTLLLSNQKLVMFSGTLFAVFSLMEKINLRVQEGWTWELFRLKSLFSHMIAWSHDPSPTTALNFTRFLRNADLRWPSQRHPCLVQWRSRRQEEVVFDLQISLELVLGFREWVADVACNGTGLSLLGRAMWIPLSFHYWMFIETSKTSSLSSLPEKLETHLVNASQCFFRIMLAYCSLAEPLSYSDVLVIEDPIQS